MAKDYASAFYNSGRWKKTQALYMDSRNYICEACGGVACIVHHITHISPENISDPDITLNPENLMALCQTCHNAEHGGGKAVADGVSFNGNGDLVYTPRSVSSS